jgi:ribulose-5-phosphate 4-epimerase/fuculose-1-phosphate aldolase
MTPEPLEALGIRALRETVCALHAELVRNGLVAWTSGNVSARVPGSAELMVIKASGEPAPLPADQVDALYARYQNHYGQR